MGFVLWTVAWSENISMAQRWPRRDGAFRDTVPGFVFACVLVPSAEGETEVLNTQRSAVSPLIPFCKHCFAVEHENKNKIKNPPKKQTNKNTRLFFLKCFYFGDFYWWLFPRVCGSALWIDGKHRQNIKSAYFLFHIESELLCSSLEVIFCNNKELQNNSWWKSNHSPCTHWSLSFQASSAGSVFIELQIFSAVQSRSARVWASRRTQKNQIFTVQEGLFHNSLIIGSLIITTAGKIRTMGTKLHTYGL